MSAHVDLDALVALPYFSDHSPETFQLVVQAARRVAREALYPAYREMDREPRYLENGTVTAHPAMRAIYPQLVELGVLNATRPEAVGGQQLPQTVFGLATLYLMAANLSAYAYVGLTTGAARLIESFGSEELCARFMAPMYDGRWTGTMALTEPQAGSSLTDVKAKAIPTAGEHYLLQGSKVFISGGDHDLVENIVHLTLARIEGAPEGIKGVSLFAIPKVRPEEGALVDNDCTTAGVFEKIGWRGLPSIALNFGERGDCYGWLVGEPHTGIRSMFQMMNEARLMVGANGVATASVAYHESLLYARDRPQGRKFSQRDPSTPQVPIIEHADVRRMLLRQKSIVEGGMALVVHTAYLTDLAEHGVDEATRARCSLLVDLLTPITKSFPAEWGFESNALAVQIHGGYGYTSEYPPEAWLRDQKLNSIHEGTTGIHSIDLLGRKVMMKDGAALRVLVETIGADAEAATAAHPKWAGALMKATMQLVTVTRELATRGDPETVLMHSASYLEAASIIVIAWQWLKIATAATDRPASDFVDGKLRAASYWFRTELPLAASKLDLATSGETSFANMQDASF